MFESKIAVEGEGQGGHRGRHGNRQQTREP